MSSAHHLHGNDGTASIELSALCVVLATPDADNVTANAAAVRAGWLRRPATTRRSSRGGPPPPGWSGPAATFPLSTSVPHRTRGRTTGSQVGRRTSTGQGQVRLKVASLHRDPAAAARRNASVGEPGQLIEVTRKTGPEHPGRVRAPRETTGTRDLQRQGRRTGGGSLEPLAQILGSLRADLAVEGGRDVPLRGRHPSQVCSLTPQRPLEVRDGVVRWVNGCEQSHRRHCPRGSLILRPR